MHVQNKKVCKQDCTDDNCCKVYDYAPLKHCNNIQASKQHSRRGRVEICHDPHGGDRAVEVVVLDLVLVGRLVLHNVASRDETVVSAVHNHFNKHTCLETMVT